MHFNNRYSCYTPVSMGTEIKPKRRGHVQKKETSIVLVNSNTRKKSSLKKKKSSILGLIKIAAYQQKLRYK